MWALPRHVKYSHLCILCALTTILIGLANDPRENKSATEIDPEAQRALDQIVHYQQEAQKLMAIARGDAYTARTAPAHPSSAGTGARTVPPSNRRIANAPATLPAATPTAPSSGGRLIYVSIEARVGKQICHHLASANVENSVGSVTSVAEVTEPTETSATSVTSATEVTEPTEVSTFADGGKSPARIVRNVLFLVCAAH